MEKTRHERGQAGQGQALKTLQGCFRDCEPRALQQEETSKVHEEQRKGRVRAVFPNYVD